MAYVLLVETLFVVNMCIYATKCVIELILMLTDTYN